jgi:hypothetical protein
MAKILEFEVVNNCNREIRIQIGNGSNSVPQGGKKKFKGEEGQEVKVWPYNASYTKVVGHITGATIVVSGYDK